MRNSSKWPRHCSQASSSRPGTPDAIARRLHDAAVATMETTAVQAQLQRIGSTVVSPERRSSEYLQKFVEGEIARWAAPIKASGVTLN